MQDREYLRQFRGEDRGYLYLRLRPHKKLAIYFPIDIESVKTPVSLVAINEILEIGVHNSLLFLFQLFELMLDRLGLGFRYIESRTACVSGRQSFEKRPVRQFFGEQPINALLQWTASHIGIAAGAFTSNFAALTHIPVTTLLSLSVNAIATLTTSKESAISKTLLVIWPRSPDDFAFSDP